eukprot:3132845-Prymnesium_polylepis.1
MTAISERPTALPIDAFDSPASPRTSTAARSSSVHRARGRGSTSLRERTVDCRRCRSFAQLDRLMRTPSPARGGGRRLNLTR